MAIKLDYTCRHKIIKALDQPKLIMLCEAKTILHLLIYTPNLLKTNLIYVSKVLF